MYLKHIRLLKGRILFLLVAVLLIGLTSSGCIKGLQPIGWSGGAISEGTLFVGSKEGRLVAINMADGGRQWSEPLRASTASGGFGCMPVLGGGCATGQARVAIYGTPAVSGDLVYIGGYNGKIYAYNSSSLGEAKWVYPPADNIGPIVGGLTVAHDKVYFGSSDGKVYAVDAAMGDKQWEFETGDQVWSTPTVEDDTLYVGSFDKKLYALNATDGSKKWEFLTEGAITSAPLVYENTVYFGSFDRHLYAVDAIRGTLKWKFMSENWFWAKPVVINNTVYAGSLDGKVYALRADSGSKVKEFDLGSPVSSVPVVIDNSIIFASRKGVIYRLDTDSNQLRLLADVEEEVYGPLSASEGIVYIHTQDLRLHRVNADTGAMLMPISLKSSE